MATASNPKRPEDGERGDGREPPQGCKGGGRTKSTGRATRPLLDLPEYSVCQIVRRANRFVVEIDVDGKPHRAWINNSGRLSEFMVEGTTGYCFPHQGKKTKYRLFAVQEEGRDSGALIDTNFQMRSFEAAVKHSQIPWLKGWEIAAREPKLGSGKTDYLLQKGGNEETALLEVKSAVLRVGENGELASYPDCPTIRGQRHIKELTKHAKNGGRAFVCFACALPGVTGYMPWDDGDPKIRPLLQKAMKGGVDVKAISMRFDPWAGKRAGAVVLDEPDLPVFLD